PRAQIIDWSSADLSIADVSRTGLVTAVGPGATMIIARAAGATPDTATLEVESSIAALSVHPEAVSAFEGDSLRFSASATLASGSSLESPKVAWSSSDTSIAVVDGGGFVISVGSGDVFISADYLGVRARAAVNVRESEVANMSVSPANKTMYVNSQAKLHAALRDYAGRNVSRSTILWTSSNASVATVANDGTVAGKGVGFSIITAKSGEKAASATINVLGAPATTVAVTISQASISAGQTAQATANLVDKDGNVLTGRQIAWQSSNPSIATVNSSGVVTGIAAGNVTISAIVDAIVGRASLSVVSALPTALRIDPASASLSPLQSVQLTAVETDQN
ncbi:MAG: Ig-like domain-containing protein, partial [Vicinamibacterales bacterium]